MASTPAPLTAHAAALQRLGDLKGRLDLSARRWQQVQQLVPASMRTLVKPGACDDFDWCIVVALRRRCGQTAPCGAGFGIGLKNNRGKKSKCSLTYKFERVNAWLAQVKTRTQNWVVPARGVEPPTFALQTGSPTEYYAVAPELLSLSLLLSWLVLTKPFLPNFT